MKIYVSSSSIKNEKIHETLIELFQNGFHNIELSGGSKHYNELKNDIISLKKQYHLNLLIHNYFPPPEQHFVLNLASLDDEIYTKTIEHYLLALDLSKTIGADCFSIHAGFLIDISPDEIGTNISLSQNNKKENAIERFSKGYNIIKQKAENINLYIENNVLNKKNFQTFNINPFLLTTAKDYFELKQSIEFNLLLDIAHLKVSCTTLGVDFEEELGKLASVSNYWHISDNNGLIDSNNPFFEDSEIVKLIRNFSADIITLEVYDDINEIKRCHQILSNIYSL
ncbi:MAG: xylose isomerase [Candidatus Magnetoglobus multicellularis str. Araruama]|uniref:Xylose isomerase n=1 Tax=Candidatus Magnetoglobus multicellularis str. Araruama TaxID=890399 RepID=A0A1V1PA10_9BACT|nr:MAG: xylose isomerase [Candidatus Magnetoglobus multicellularis str. Araruama]